MGLFKRIFNPVSGLIESNVSAYFVARGRGMEHTDGLRYVIQSRYPGGGPAAEELLNDLEDYLESSDDDPEEQLADTVGKILFSEVTAKFTFEQSEAYLMGRFDAQFAKWAEEITAEIAKCKQRRPGVF